MRDPYDILGVSKNASAAEVKSAFRRQAKKLHPDANKHDPKAASRFAELNAAYEILGEADKRKAFDRGEIDAEGKPRFRGFEGFGGRQRGGAGHAGPDIDFEQFSFGPDGVRHAGGRAAGMGNFEDVLSNVLGGLGGRRDSSALQRGHHKLVDRVANTALVSDNRRRRLHQSNCFASG
jgi:curved DNA-binding protein CbpA